MIYWIINSQCVFGTYWMRCRLTYFFLFVLSVFLPLDKLYTSGKNINISLVVTSCYYLLTHKTKQRPYLNPLISTFFPVFWTVLDFFLLLHLTRQLIALSYSKNKFKNLFPQFLCLWGYFFYVWHRLFYYIFAYILHKSPSFCILRDVHADL